ncbi:MAG: PQQ-binding-like beta-propeller repeat protein [Myxococcales bacterium]|nr:PQQ-binding-like beta-propeller repeat protein [Myxococcales bacterium]
MNRRLDTWFTLIAVWWVPVVAMVGCSDDDSGTDVRLLDTQNGDGVTSGDLFAGDVATDSGNSEGFGYDVPLSPGSPWPKFRRDARQTGLSPIKPVDDPTHSLWSFPTGKGVFSSPVIGEDGTIYIGSADRTFYALTADGQQRWSYPTGEIIDSAALLDDLGHVYVGSGDGRLYAFDAATGDPLWMFEADSPTVTGAFIRWFEGNVAILPDGTLVVPNDNWRIYGIDRNTGTQKWAVSMPEQTWSLPAIDVAHNRWFVGNNNFLPWLGDNVFAFDFSGTSLWGASTLGTISASPVVVADGAAIVGSFDGFVHRFDANTGDSAWSVPTRDHIYASPGLTADNVLIQPSGDGTVYAVSPDTGVTLWAYDTLEPIRSSPAIDGNGRIYVGSGEGRLFVLEPDGKLRWAIRLTDGDRNDFNSSPALGESGIVIAGESGEIWHVPFDYCLRPEAAADSRCWLGPGEDLPEDGASLLFVTPFGTPKPVPPPTILVHQPLAFQLFVRKNNDTQLALIDNNTLTVEIDPPTTAFIEVSGDRRFVTIVPKNAFIADNAEQVRIKLSGNYLLDPERTGLATTGGTFGGTFQSEFLFTLEYGKSSELALLIPDGPGSPGAVWELSRLAAPLPTLLPSYNQIGFDSLHYLLGLVEGTPEKAVGWVIGAKTDETSGKVVPDPTSKALFPVEFRYENGLVWAESHGGFTLEVLSATLAFSEFRMRGKLTSKGVSTDPFVVSVQTHCGDIPFFGVFLKGLGLCHPNTDILDAFGAILWTRDPKGGTTAAAGLGKVTFNLTETSVVATVTDSTAPADKHRFALLLVDSDTDLPIPFSYGPNTTVKTNEFGKLTEVSVTVNIGELPTNVRVWLMVDTSPGAMGHLTTQDK